MVTTSYKTAIYCRLSVEDGNEESSSISSQKDILTDYVNKQGWNIVDYYIDDGYSGTNFNRPSFQRLLKDIECGVIDIVVTKDLSRLGRNYIQTGYYTEEYFPEHNVRYIAVNDNYDTINDDSNDFVPFKNIINEWYAKDISKKIRFTLDSKAKKGEPRRTVFPIFGYMFNENYERVPDPETAPIVKFIFDEYLRTASSDKVAKTLTKKKVKLPCYYNAIKYNYNRTVVLNRSEEELTRWTAGGIRDILERAEYLGTYITAKSKSKSFKIKKRIDNPNAYVFENRYEPIIDKITFESAQRLLKRCRNSPLPAEMNLFKGLVTCSKCGHVMRFERKSGGNNKGLSYHRYFCKKCRPINQIQKKYIEEYIKMDLLNLKRIILNHEEEFLSFVNNYQNNDSKMIEKKTNVLDGYVKKSEEVDSFIVELFEQNQKGLIPESTYDSMMTKYRREKEHLDSLILSLEKERQQNNNEDYDKSKAVQVVDLLKETNEDNVLDFKLIHSLIKEIQVLAVKKEGFERKYDIDIDIFYASLDPIIKEFMKKYE